MPFGRSLLLFLLSLCDASACVCCGLFLFLDGTVACSTVLFLPYCRCSCDVCLDLGSSVSAIISTCTSTVLLYCAEHTRQAGIESYTVRRTKYLHGVGLSNTTVYYDNDEVKKTAAHNETTKGKQGKYLICHKCSLVLCRRRGG